MNIILVGYMGCGKTTVGKQVAKLHQGIFIDTDEEIERNEQRTISDIFAQNGESAFRDLETQYLQKLVRTRKDHLVLSTGGGMTVREENRQSMKELGKVVYLRAKPETIYERVKDDTKRPLLQCENPMEKIRQMIQDRGPAYEEAADFVVDVDNMNQWDVANTIMERIKDK